MRGLVAGLGRVDAPADFEFRLRARMSAADSSQTRSRTQNLLPRATWLAAAGCLVFAAALALQTRNSPTRGALETAAPSATMLPVSGSIPAAGADTASREVPGETAGVTPASQSTISKKEVNETAVKQRRGQAAPPTAASAVRLSQRHPAAAAAPQLLREAAASGGNKITRTETNTSSMMGSPVIVSSAIPLPVSVDERPLQVLFNDTQGASRVVNVAPVAFGSNEPAARPKNVTFTKTTKKQGVW